MRKKFDNKIGSPTIMGWLLIFMLLLLTQPIHAQASCFSIAETAEKFGVFVAGEDSEMEVIEPGKLQFYYALDVRCKRPGVFILPGGKVDAYTEFREFTSVVYINPKNGADVTGWVKSSRLGHTGPGIAPR